MTPTPLPEFAEIVRQAPDAVILVDQSGCIAYANDRVAHLFGRSSAELAGQPIEILIPDRLREGHGVHRQAYARAPRIRPMGDSREPLIGLRADGGEFPVDIHLAPIESDGRRWMLAVVRDATARHRFLEELRAARRASEAATRIKGEFLAMAAHDLSQPLQTLELIVGSIDRRGAAGPRSMEFATEAAAQLARMRELVRMLSDISGMESGAREVVAEPVSVAEIFANLARQFEPVAQAKALGFSADPSGHVVETDPALLRGMLSNLVSNAIRYTPAGHVAVRCVVPADGGLKLAVADTGIGIPQDQLGSIFADFHRLAEARRLNQDGFGLGLGIVRRLSALLELPVTVESTPGRGSTFMVEIPRGKILRAA